MNELALFGGVGGGILGSKLLGWRTVCAVEINAYARSVLLQRQTDKILDPFPVWDDIETFDGKPWAGQIQVISGGFPCQDISCNGTGKGLAGKRSGLWAEFARIIGEVRPQFVFVENSPFLKSRGLGTVLGDLSQMGYNAEWGVLGADACGAHHHRARIWVVAYSNSVRDNQNSSDCELRTDRIEQPSKNSRESNAEEIIKRSQGLRWFKQDPSETGKEHPTEPRLGRVADGISDRVDRVKASGNAQVPIVASTAFRVLKERAGI